MSSIYSFKKDESSTVNTYGNVLEENTIEADNQSKNSINSDTYFYTQYLYENLNVLNSALNKLSTIHNSEIRMNAEYILNLINRDLVTYQNYISNKFNEILLNELEDESVLLEWNFEKLRVGFALEKDDNESSYYIVENDRETGHIKTESSLIKTKDYSQVISSVIDYLVRNT